VILVGHNLAGPVISEVAEHAGNRITQLIYVAAFLLQDGENCLSMIARLDSQPMGKDLVTMRNGAAAILAPAARALFYQKCTVAQANRATERLTPQPVGIFTESVGLSETFARVPRSYIETLHDPILPIGLQREMQARLPCRPVITLDSDHAPFLSMPRRLATAIIQVATDAPLFQVSRPARAHRIGHARHASAALNLGTEARTSRRVAPPI
jgi:pimeloyl-ACP methyl ester carboxylesterase